MLSGTVGMLAEACYDPSSMRFVPVLRRGLPAFVLGLAAVASVAAQDVSADRILAVVDEDPILASDVRQVIALGLVETSGESGEALERRVLDQLVEQRLRFHEIDRFGFAELPADVVERRYRELLQESGGERELRKRLADVGLDENGLKELLARQVMVLTYVEERLGPRVFVGLDEIRQYYDEVLEPEMRRQGQAVPRLSDVREQIRAVLKQQRLNDEIERWTEELRAAADVSDYFDERHDELPPVQIRVDDPAS